MCDYRCILNVFVKGKIEEYITIIMQYVEVIWLCKLMRRTKCCSLILRSDFRRGLCGEKGENKNSRAVKRPKTGVSLRLNWYYLAYRKTVIFGG